MVRWGLKWWQWGIVVGYAMYGWATIPAESAARAAGGAVGALLGAYLLVYGARRLWGWGRGGDSETTTAS